MTSSLKALLGATAALALAGAAAGAIAQSPPGGPPQGGPGGFRGGPPPSPEMREQMLSERLGLRADQAPALKAFLAATGPEANRGERRDMRAMTTPERLDRQLEDLRRRADATKRFYAQLTPEQKLTFDSTPMPGMGGPGGRGGPGGGGRRGQGGFQGGPNQGFGAPPPQ